MLVKPLDFRSWIPVRKSAAEPAPAKPLNFLLGVGCQKGGTTWLHDYLKTHPKALLSPMKEMHVFDAIYRPDLFSSFYRRRLTNLERAVEELLKQDELSPRDNTDLRKRLDLLQIYHDPKNYNAYFAELVAKKRRGRHVSLVGEITPSYSALSGRHFKAIRELLLKDFNRIKVVFLMRDPIERILSAHRMVDRKRRERGKTVEASAYNTFKDVYSGQQEFVRTAYDRTIRSLERAFKPEEIFYGFYETLFTEAEIRRLCDFLEIAYRPADFEKRVNASPSEGKVDAESLKEARAFYDKTYRFCVERFSEDFIKSIWRNY